MPSSTMLSAVGSTSVGAASAVDVAASSGVAVTTTVTSTVSFSVTLVIVGCCAPQAASTTVRITKKANQCPCVFLRVPSSIKTRLLLFRVASFCGKINLRKKHIRKKQSNERHRFPIAQPVFVCGIAVLPFPNVFQKWVYSSGDSLYRCSKGKDQFTMKGHGIFWYRNAIF